LYNLFTEADRRHHVYDEIANATELQPTNGEKKGSV